MPSSRNHEEAACQLENSKTRIAFSATKRQSTKMGLAVNEGKTKYMLSTSRDGRLIGSQITANNTFD